MGLFTSVVKKKGEENDCKFACFLGFFVNAMNLLGS